MQEDNSVKNAVEQGGSYEVIRKRLDEGSKKLLSQTEALNNSRQEQFGSLKQELIAKLNIHTENSCTPVDMTQVNGYVFFGYNVFMGMKNQVTMDDVFALYKMEKEGVSYKAVHVPLKDTFLDDVEFKKAFNNLFSYYKDTRLFQLLNDNENIYVVFQIGQSIKDLKVFKWTLDKTKNYVYSGESSPSEIIGRLENTFNKWVKTDRSNFVSGKFPHISIKDKVFVETIGGDLTIKVENNTDKGQGIYSEPVENSMQNLEDAEISYVEAGDSILLKIKPYQEEKYRYFIFNTLTQTVIRCDGIGLSCVELPEDHGFVFSDGYYLKSGEHKVFDIKNKYFFLKSIKSPNGEDYLYVFFDPYEKTYVLYPYNLVTKSISTPIFTNGYSLHENGHLYVIKAGSEANRVHPLQLWQTSLLSDTVYEKEVKNSEVNFYTKIGNSELVRCISEVYTVNNLISKKEVSTTLYEGIIKLATKLLDDYHWLDDSEAFGLKASIQNIIDTSILIVNEFEKVVSIQKQAKESLELATNEQRSLVSLSKSITDKDVSKYIEMLGKLKQQLGRLITIKSQRYIDVPSVEKLELEINEAKTLVNDKLIVLLQDKNAFEYYIKESTNIDCSLASIKKVVDLKPLEEQVDNLLSQINIVNDEINDIEFKDSTVVSLILDSISNVFAKLNQIKSKIKNIKKTLMSGEAKIEFAAQFKLLSQSVSSAITASDTPEKCDESMTRVLNQVEGLESKFADFDEFLVDIQKKRDEIKDIFENHKQQLVNERQKRINSIENASKITLNSIQKKVEKIKTADEMNSFFASDSLVLKYQQFVKNILELGDNIKSDELFGAFKNVKDQSLRQLRDTQDIFEDNGNIMKMGKHRFSVSKTPFDLTLINKDNKMFLHLTSTNFYQEITDDKLETLRTYWEHDVVSESADIYRAEYLAYSVLKDAEESSNGLSINSIEEAINNKNLLALVSSYSATLYKEGYIRGVHDNDATAIFEKLYTVYKNSETLKFKKASRLLAALYLKDNQIEDGKVAAYKKAISIKSKIGNDKLFNNVINEIKALIDVKFKNSQEFSFEAAHYILESKSLSFQYPETAKTLYEKFEKEAADMLVELNDMNDCDDLISIIKSYSEFKKEPSYSLMAEEMVIYALLKAHSPNAIKIDTVFTVEGLIGQHARIQDSTMTIEFDDFINRSEYHNKVVMPAYETVNEIKYTVLSKEKEKLRIQDFKAKPLSSFVRNKLITEAYLPLIGDNLAKQMGTVGEKKRTDLMGLLLLISPPGYGKTTIIEYIAQKLGLVFVKINCPSLGHSVTSLDPREAPDVTSRKEVEKINLAFEMGNNVMLYLDDIQHTNPEFLQKFISLCDGSRKADGVWEGKPKTYDLKGKKFAIVMAGNPYTESGEVFKVPDMLSNRADTYNLGDMLSGQQEVFELSYIENSLTSNAVLAPLATRNLDDLYKFIDMAKGSMNHPLNEFEYNYSQAEATEIVDVIKKMLNIQKVVLKVNQQYIASASTNDLYRVEPPFKLQGSYRNMNKMSEKVVSVMNDEEANAMVMDHYVGEAQTLTQGTEDNLLKLKEILGIQTDVEKERWEKIKKDYVRSKTVGNADTDGFTKIAQQLSLMSEAYKENLSQDSSDRALIEQIAVMNDNISRLIPNNEKEEAITELFKTIKDLNDYLLRKAKKRDV
jgi:hypothetical protein